MFTEYLLHYLEIFFFLAGNLGIGVSFVKNGTRDWFGLGLMQANRLGMTVEKQHTQVFVALAFLHLVFNQVADISYLLPIVVYWLGYTLPWFTRALLFTPFFLFVRR